MGLFTKNEPQPAVGSITAAAGQVAIAGTDPDKDLIRKAKGGQEWQRQAWDFYDEVGELHYSVFFYTACLRRIKLRIALKDRSENVTAAFDDEGVPQHTQADQAADLLRTLKPSIGGQGELLAIHGGNLVVAGECYLYGEPGPDGGFPDWEVLSVEELVSEGDIGPNPRFLRVGPDGKKIEVPENTVVLRIWRPHFRHTQLADSAINPLLDVLEELVLLTQGVRATVLSRLAGAGILKVPDEISPPKQQDGKTVDKFVDDLMVAMLTPIKDRRSAAAVIPLVVRGPGDRLDQMKFDEFSKPIDSAWVDLRKEAIERFAQGIDLPVEIVTGSGGTNHWSAWQIDESTFKAHIEPLMELMADAFTDWLEIIFQRLGYGDLQSEDGKRLIVSYDPSELVTHPDQAKDAAVLHARYVISDAKLREVSGFSDSDKPDDDELVVRLERDRSLKPTNGQTPTDGGSVDKGPPATELDNKITAAIEVSVDRAVERFGAKVRNKLNGQASRTLIDGVANSNVAAALGPATVKTVMGDDLFGSEFASISRSVVRWAMDNGVEPVAAMEMAASAELRAEGLAQAMLYDTKRG